MRTASSFCARFATAVWIGLAASSLAFASGDPKDPAKAARPDDVATVDVNTIDPERFAAIATRLEPGEEIDIDGHLEEGAWQRALPNGNFIQREPDLGRPASQRTEFKILYDDRHIYFGVWAFDNEPEKILATEMKRDSGLRKGDQIKISIDTFHDKRNAFYFSTNPLAALKDANSTENGRVINYDWNGVWRNRTSRDGQGWYVEIAIPLSQLRFAGGPGEAIWGLNVCRILLRRNEDSYWVPFPREWSPSGFARMSGAGKLLGLRDLKPRRRLEVVPFLAPSLTRNDIESSNSQTTGYGFDARLGLTGSLTADLTYKTDFAQVEADQEVVNLSRFSVFFPEKRQFFTESAGIFDYGRSGVGFSGGDGGGGGFGGDGGLLPIFYSRRVGLSGEEQIPIVGGGKVTGRTGAYSLGLLNMQTEDSTGTDGVFRPGGNYTALRIKRNILKQSTLGGMFLNRQNGPGASFNRTAALDLGLVLGRSVGITGMLARTFSPQGLSFADGTANRGDGLAAVADLSWKTDAWDVGATYVDIARTFNAEMGFIRRTDIRNLNVDVNRTWRPKIKGVRTLRADLRVDHFENHEGVMESRGYDAGINWQRPSGSNIRLSWSRDFDRLSEGFETFAGVIPRGAYWWNNYRANFFSGNSNKLGGFASVEGGGYYQGRKQSFRTGLNFVPSGTLLIEGNYSRNQLQLPGAPRASSNVFGARLSYSFSPNLFVKAYAQMNDEREVTSLNLLFWYIFRPGSDLYVVYNQGWDQDKPGLPFLSSRDKSLIVKMTWWWSR